MKRLLKAKYVINNTRENIDMNEKVIYKTNRFDIIDSVDMLHVDRLYRNLIIDTSWF